jgi:transposase
VGASVPYLPPHSPEFNPIELCWSKLKEFLRSQATRTVEALDRSLAQGFDRIHWRDIVGWFKHGGYVPPI